MPFKSVFAAMVTATALIVAAFLVNARRPRIQRNEPYVGVGLLLLVVVRLETEDSPAFGWWGVRRRYRTTGTPIRSAPRVGAPAFAPLLFADLTVLAALGLWALSRTGTSQSAFAK
jgi:hypothetical protein